MPQDRRRELLDLLDKLVGFAACTVNNANQAVLFAAEWLKSRGIMSRVYDNCGKLSLVTTDVYQSDFAFNGHLDVVPGTKEQFTPRIDGDRYYARGSYDMLGAAAAAMLTAAALKKEGFSPPAIAFSSTEETDGAAGTGYMVEQGHGARFVICGEPTDFNIAVEAKGILRLKVTFQGVSAHGSRPWLGDNAIMKGLAFCHGIQELPFMQEKTETYPSPSLNIAWIQGGDRYNQVPDLCELGMEIRYLPGQDTDKIIEEIRTHFPGEEIETVKVIPSVKVDRKNRYVRLLQETAAGLGAGASFIGQHGASDARFYTAKNMPAVEFGLAGSGHHGPCEWVSVGSLERYAQMLYIFYKKLSQTADGEEQ